MRLIDRYLFRQLRASTVLAATALTGIALLSQSLSALDILMDQRQSPLIFFKLTLLATPQLLILILPIALLVGGLGALHRLHAEREFVICFSAGMSRWGVLSPSLRLSLWVALVILLLALWVQPLCYRMLRQTLDQVRTDLAGALIKAGQFTHPAPGLTVYVQAIDDGDEPRNIFIDQDNGRGRDNTLTAREGQIERRSGAPVLILRHGSNQSYSRTGVLNFLSFDEYVVDLRALLRAGKDMRYKVSDLYPHELFFPDRRRAEEIARGGQLLAEGHARLSAPLYAVAFLTLAAAAILGDPGGRFGEITRMTGAGAIALIDRTAGFAAQGAAASNPGLNLLQYLVPVAAMALGIWFLFRRPSPRLEERPPSLGAGAGQRA